MVVTDEKSSKVIIHDSSGDQISIEGMIPDSEMLHRSIVENIRVGIAIIDDRYRILYSNSEMTNINGYSREELIGKDFRFFISEISKEALSELYVKRQKGEKVPDRYEATILNKGGGFRDVEISSSLIVDGTGRRLTVTKLLDMTDRNRMVKALRDSEEKYRLVVDNAYEAIFVVQDGKFKFYNLRALEIAGVDEENVDELYFTDLIHPDYREEMMERYYRRLDGEELDSRIKFRILDVDGKSRWVEINTVVIEWEGRPASLNFLNEITDEVMAKEELISERNRAELYLDLLGHDIGNIHQAISLGLDMLDNVVSDTEKRKELMSLMRSQITRSIRLAGNVKMLSELSKPKVDLEPVDITGKLLECKEMVRSVFPDKEMDITLEGPDESVLIMADSLYEELCFNLVHNSIKFQRGQRARVDIRWGFIGGNGTVFVSIADQGPGIPDHMKKGIFDRYGSHRERSGSGIGLTLVKQLVERYNGTIEVEDRIKGDHTAGSLFTITFPGI